MLVGGCLGRAARRQRRRQGARLSWPIAALPLTMAETTTAAAVLAGVESIVIEKRPVPSPPAGQVRIRVHSVGICGSDLHYFKDGKIKGLQIPFPSVDGFKGVMGHECSGTVEELGPGVTELKVGDRVALEAGMPCGTCRTCREGRYNLCKDNLGIHLCLHCLHQLRQEMRFLGSFLSKCPGALCEIINHPACFCFKVPENVSLEEAALLEPLNVALAAVKRGAVTIGSRVLVTGAGPVGIITMMAARACGATHVTISDVQDARLALAKQLGANETVNSRQTDLVESVRSGHTQPFDVTIECSGVDVCIGSCIRCTRSGGKCVLVGIGASADATIPLADATGREVDLIGVFRYCNLYRPAVDLVAAGLVDLKPLISHHFPLEKTADAFRAALQGGDAIKVLIHPNGVPPGAEEAAAKRRRLAPPGAGGAGGAPPCACCGGLAGCLLKLPAGKSSDARTL